MAVFLPARFEGKAIVNGQSILYRAKTLDTHRIPATGALGAATVKYPG